MRYLPLVLHSAGWAREWSATAPDDGPRRAGGHAWTRREPSQAIPDTKGEPRLKSHHQLKARFRLPLTGMLAATAVVTGFTMPAPIASASTPAAQPAARAQTADAARYRDESAALKIASSSHRPVVVQSLTTEVSQTVASPNGSLTNTTYALPVRIRLRDSWHTLSATLKSDPDRTWAPAAAASGVKLSGGGIGPLATLSSPDGSRLAISFPTPLPRPSVAGSALTYRSVWPGVDLRVTATTLGGVDEQLIIHSRQAAADPALRRLAFPLSTRGLNVDVGPSGGLRATNSDGRVDFTGTHPFMWAPPLMRRASIATEAQAKVNEAFQPATLTANRGSIYITPNAKDLIASSTFPVSLFFSISAAPTNCGTLDNQNESCGGSQEGFDEVQQGCANYQNWNDVLGSTGFTGNGIGYSPSSDACAGVDRSFYIFNTSGLDSGMQVISSKLTAWVNYSADWNCNDSYGITVKWVNGISQSTDWTNQPGVNPGNENRSYTSKTGPNPNSTCSQQTVDFDVTYAMKLAAAGNNNTWTFGFFGDESSSDNGFMRIGDNPNIVTTFDRIPPMPTAFATIPATYDTPGGSADSGCSSNVPWLNATDTNNGASDLQLNAHATAAVNGEPVRTDFYAVDETNGTTYTLPSSAWMTPSSGSVPGSGTANVLINFKLQDGHTYGWGANAEVSGIPQGSDGPFISPEPGNGQVLYDNYPCMFHYDGVSPNSPTVTSTAFPASGSGLTGQDAGTSGTFNFKSSDPTPTCPNCVKSGVYEFEYSLNSPLSSNYPTIGCGSTSGAVRASSGNATSCAVSVGDWGTNTLYVAAIDQAGNVSQSYQYSFYAPWNPATKVVPGDITGDGVPDIVGTGSSAGDLQLIKGGQDPADPPIDANNGGNPTQPCATTCSPDGTSWNTFQIAHRGSMTQGSVDDLFVHKGSFLYIYENLNGGAVPQFGQTSYSERVTIGRPACSVPADNADTCASTEYDPTDWSNVTSILAPGDAWNPTPGTTGSASSSDNNLPSLLTVENGELWLFQGENGPGLNLQDPVMLGSSGWNNVSLLAPGTIGGRLSIWAYNYSTGKIFSYPITLVDGVPSLSATGSPVSATSGSVLLTFKPSSTAAPAVAAYGPGTNYPGVYFATSPGSADANGGTCTNGCLWYLRGTSSATAPLNSTPIFGGSLSEPISQLG